VPGFKEAWLGVAARLARRFRVVTFDLRVRSPGTSWDQQLEDLERVADAFAPGEAFVAGHSLGGALALRWTLARPRRVRALVLSSSFAVLGGHTPPHWRKRYFEQLLVLASQRLLPEALAAPAARSFARAGAWVYDPDCDERLLGFVRYCIRHHSIAVARECVRLAWRHDLRDDLGRIENPTLVVVGERESRWALSAARDLAARIPGAELRVSPGVSHLHPLSAPAWLATTMETWLDGRGEAP
jgi:pimeloyl-ACP methyl ester carboxylesterase